MNSKMLMTVGVLLSAFSAQAKSVGSAPYALYSRDGKITIDESDGKWRVVHTGKHDWSLTAKDASFKVMPGEMFKMTCTAGEILAKNDIGMGVMLCGRDGKAIQWSYARTQLVPNGTAERTFAIPPGGARISARITSHGDADFSVGALKLERVGALTTADGLPERLALESSALSVAIRSDTLALLIADRRTGRTWETCSGIAETPSYLVRNFKADRRQIRLEVTDMATLDELTIDYRLDEKAPSELVVTVAVKGRLAASFAYPAPIAGRKGDMIILPLSEGFRLPMHEETFEVHERAMWSSAMSMAFFGIEEDATGAGWMAIAETRNDAKVKVVGKKKPIAIGPVWAPERGKYGYPRVVRYAFFDRGGYVAMANRYRRTAEAEGLVKTFREKAKKRPNVDRLLGAPNIWYFRGYREPSSAEMARELQAAGIGRFLWSNNPGEGEVAQIAALPDVLVGRYDCYRDIYHPPLLAELGWKMPKSDICKNTAAWPDCAIWNSADSNDLRKAWGVTGKDGKKHYCAAQCTLCQPDNARRHVAEELKARPFTSRFIDVTMAVGAEECENPAHPMTRTQSRQAGCELLGLMGDEFGLVVGSEQGIDFAVPSCDYFEGMMSPGSCRMPHGRPGAQRQNIFREGLNPTNVTPVELSKVIRFGLGEKYRIPLFELVYHDCCCAHWYWYDYSNRPISLWAKRDLFNVLYGTAPMYIFDHRLWKERKEMFVKSYQTVCPVARRTGYSRMTDHRVLTPDRSVQQSTFADGTMVTVNFGDKPYRCADGRCIGPMGFHVKE